MLVISHWRGSRTNLTAFLLISATAGTASAALTAVGGITASANAWDTRTSGYGCAPSGCIAEKAVDGSLESMSRWSCKADAAGVRACELTLALDAPRDIEAVRVALWKGDTRSRAIDVSADGGVATTIVSSGTTDGYETYAFGAMRTTTVTFRGNNVSDNGWLSILEVQLLVDDGLGSAAPTPTPTAVPSSEVQAMTGAPVLAPAGGEKCPGGTFGVNGEEPCTECPGERVSAAGMSYCTVRALRNVRTTEAVATAIEADAAGGFLSPGRASFDGGIDGYNTFPPQPVYLYEENGDVLDVSGTFETEDGSALPDSAALFLYLVSEDTPLDYVRSEGTIDPFTGAFSATVVDIPLTYSTIILSFVALDPSDAIEPPLTWGNSAFVVHVVNEGCSEAPLRFSLDWEGEDVISAVSYVFSYSDPSMYLFVEEPSGNMLSQLNSVSEIGYLNLDRQEYVVFGGLSGDAMLGEYQVLARYYNPRLGGSIDWSLTAEKGTQLVWTEQGSLSRDDEVFASRRRLATSWSSLYTESTLFDDDLSRYDDDPPTSYAASPVVQTEWFSATLESYASPEC